MTISLNNAYYALGGPTGAGSSLQPKSSGSPLYGEATIAGAKLLSGLFEQQVSAEEEAKKRQQEAFIKGQKIQSAANDDGHVLQRNALQSLINNMRGGI